MSLEFRRKNLWENVSTGLACNGNARRIIENAKRQFGVSGKIYEVFAGQEEADIDVSHSYVVLNNQSDDDLALNQQVGTDAITVREAKQGEDITEEILKTDWEKLQ